MVRKISVFSLILISLLLVACAQPTAPVPTVDIPHATDLPTITATATAIGAAPTGTPNARPTMTEEPVPTPGTFTVTLPLVTGDYQAPVTGPIVYDCDGRITTTAWLSATFGAVGWTNVLTDGAHVAAVVAACYDQPAVLVVHVTDTAGNPAAGVTVARGWRGKDVPWLPAELRDCGFEHGVYGTTNDGGDIGFGLGRGDYYEPAKGEIGASTVWIVMPGTECLSGLGMLRFTNHWHVDSLWTVDAQLARQAKADDWGFSPGPVYEMQIGGRRMRVVGVPEDLEGTPAP